MLKVRSIEYGSSDYARAVELRDKVLRAPLGLRFDPEFLAQEKNPEHVHVAAFDGDDLVGCLILTDLGQQKLKMRQVAVDSTRQGLGIGRALVEFSERIGRERGFDEMVLNARESAVAFYLACSYETIGDTFVEVGIPHRKMRKVL